MAIVFLARHGPSASAPRGLLTASQFGAYLRGYDAVGLAATAVLPGRLVAAAANSDLVVHSPLPRAAETVRLIEAAAGPLPREEWPELVEAAQPAPAVRGLRLPLDGWDAVTRIRWLAGRPGSVEPRAHAVARARLVAERIDASGLRIPVVGHGFQNVLIARALRRLGWRGPRWPDHRHGHPTAFRGP